MALSGTGLYGVNFVLFQFTARLYKKNNNQFTPITIILFAVAWGIAVFTGFSVNSFSPYRMPKYIIYIISFFSCPIIGLAIVIFCISECKNKIAHWKQNDYTYFEHPTVDVNQNGNGTSSENCWEKTIVLPKTVTDFKVMFSFILEIAIVITYSVIESSEYSDRVTPFIIIFSLLIIWSTVTLAIRFVHTFYKVDGFMILQILISLVLVSGLFAHVYLETDGYQNATAYLVVTITLIYTTGVVLFMTFRIFIDMEFEFSCTSVCMTITAALFIELWGALTYLYTNDFYYPLVISLFIFVFGYMFFIYSRWKTNKYFF